MKIGPYTITGGTISPYAVTDRAEQQDSIDGDGGVITFPSPFDTQYLKIRFRCDIGTADNIASFIRFGMGFRRDAWTFIDPLGVSLTVRYWADDIDRMYIAPDLVEMKMTLRVEV